MGFKKARPGISLVEIVSAFAIIGLVSILIASIYFAHYRLFSGQDNVIEVSSQNKIALSEVTNEIKEAESAVSTCTNCAGDTTSATVLVLRLWPLDATGNPQDPPDASSYDYIVYKRDPTDTSRLIKKIIPGPSTSRQSQTRIIATQLTNLDFTYDNPNPDLTTEITVEITTSGTSNGKTQTTTQNSKAVMRNK